MFNNLNDLKNRAMVDEVVGHFIKLKKYGSSLKACCPFHSEKSPSFTIRKSNNTYKCFGCGKGGDSIDFVMQHQSVGFIDAVKIIAGFYNFELELENKEIAKPIPKLTKVSAEIEKWFLDERKITNNTLLRFGITESMEYSSFSKQNVKMMCFNYFRNEELINIKYRGRSKKDMKLVSNAELIFYNLDAIKDDKECVIVEGEIDALAMYEAGIYNCVSVPNGASVNGNNNLKYIDNCYEYFVDKEKIIIAVDNDEAGGKLKDALIYRFGVDRCYIVEFPNGDDYCKDANDVLIKLGKDYLSELVKNAKPKPIDGIVPSKERRERFYDLYDNGMPRGTAAGIMGLDEHIRFALGLLTMISGSPGSGKSEFLDYIAANLAMRENWRFGIFSFENQPTSIHDTKIAEKMYGKSFAHRKDPLHRINRNSLDLILNEIEDKFYMIEKDKIECTVDGILGKAEELILKFGIKGLIIDPYNKISHNIPNGMSETTYINSFLTKITNFALKWNIHIFLVAHPTKLATDSKTKKIERPTLYSIAGSANFYNQTDNGFIVYRNKDTGIVDVHIEKIRFSEQGKLGFVSFTFDTYTRQYTYASSSYPAIAVPQVYLQDNIDSRIPEQQTIFNGLSEEQQSAFD